MTRWEYHDLRSSARRARRYPQRIDRLRYSWPKWCAYLEPELLAEIRATNYMRPGSDD